MDAKEIFARTIRPLTHKSPAAAVVAFILDLAGNILCNEQGDPDALAALKKAVNINPDHIGAHAALSQVYAQKGMKANAEEEAKVVQRLTGRKSLTAPPEPGKD